MCALREFETSRPCDFPLGHIRSFPIQRLAEIRRGAIVIEGDYPDLFRIQPSRGSWLAEMLGPTGGALPRGADHLCRLANSPSSGPYRFFVAAVGDCGARAGYADQGQPELYGRFSSLLLTNLYRERYS